MRISYDYREKPRTKYLLFSSEASTESFFSSVVHSTQNKLLFPLMPKVEITAEIPVNNVKEI